MPDDATPWVVAAYAVTLAVLIVWMALIAMRLNRLELRQRVLDERKEPHAPGS